MPNLPGSSGPTYQNPGAIDRQQQAQMGETNAWYLPVVGMTSKPGQFTGGQPQWSRGSYGYQKPASKGGHVHQGVDIYAQKGAAIISPVQGTVKMTGAGGDGGNYVKVMGDDGNEYYFAHMDHIASHVSKGQRINAGMYLGGVGQSGNAQGTQAHLHFEVRRHGKSVDPNSYLETGRTQNEMPLSSIPGLNGVDQIQAYIDDMVNASFNMQAADKAGFDPSTWGGGQEPTADDVQRDQIATGQSFLGSTLDSMSQALAGGGRTPMAKLSSAMQATEGGDSVPTAAEQRQVVEADNATG